ncbi:MAG: protein-L-isoaspartate(D-aspartate) O-methyltransferase [Verrucomicrobiota bacterium]
MVRISTVKWLNPILAVCLVAVAFGQNPAVATNDPQAKQRAAMVETQIVKRGVTADRVLAAMRRVPRHRFVPPEMKDLAYEDSPLPIGHGQTISQPYIVAFMTAALELKGNEKVLEIGTGSGYQAAVFAELVKEVYSIEIVKPLGERAAKTLAEAGCRNVRTRIGDGYRGWPEAAPFDAIMVTCAPDRIPQPLIDQLAEGGRMIIPVGGPGGPQELVLLVKKAGGIERKMVLPVRFVPMTGEAER